MGIWSGHSKPASIRHWCHEQGTSGGIYTLTPFTHQKKFFLPGGPNQPPRGVRVSEALHVKLVAAGAELMTARNEAVAAVQREQAEVHEQVGAIKTQLETVDQRSAQLEQLLVHRKGIATGFSCSEAKEAGYSCAEARASGYTCVEAWEGGYNLMQIKEGGFVKGLKDAGFSCYDVRQIGYSCAEARQAGYTCVEATQSGYTCAEAKLAGYAKGFKEAGYSCAEVMHAGYSCAEARADGYSMIEVFKGGYKLGQIKNAGFVEGLNELSIQAGFSFAGVRGALLRGQGSIAGNGTGNR